MMAGWGGACGRGRATPPARKKAKRKQSVARLQALQGAAAGGMARALATDGHQKWGGGGHTPPGGQPGADASPTPCLPVSTGSAASSKQTLHSKTAAPAGWASPSGASAAKGAAGGIATPRRARARGDEGPSSRIYIYTPGFCGAAICEKGCQRACAPCAPGWGPSWRTVQRKDDQTQACALEAPRMPPTRGADGGKECFGERNT